MTQNLSSAMIIIFLIALALFTSYYNKMIDIVNDYNNEYERTNSGKAINIKLLNKVLLPYVIITPLLPLITFLVCYYRYKFDIRKSMLISSLMLYISSIIFNSVIINSLNGEKNLLVYPSMVLSASIILLLPTILLLRK